MNVWLAALMGALTLACFASAVVLLRAGPRKAVNSVGAAWLLVGMCAAMTLTMTSFPLDAPTYTYTAAAQLGFLMAGNVLFLAFVASVEGRSTRILRARPVRPVLFLAALVVFCLPFLAATGMVRPEPSPETSSGWQNEGPGYFGVILTGLATIPTGLAFLVALFREAPRASLERARTGLLLVAMLVFVGWEGAQGAFMLALDALDRPTHFAYMDGPLGYAFLRVGIPVAKTLGIALLAYAVLKTQLFDIDLKMRAGLVRGVMLGAFIVVFFAAEQLAQSILSDIYGVAVGLAAAGLLVLAVRPLERGAERLADRVMPSVHDTPEFRSARKDDVYRTAVRAALADRVLTRDEEVELARLAAELGFDPVGALALRHEVELELGILLADRGAKA